MAKYFTREEFVCQYTGTNKIKDEFIEKLDELREACGFPFIITSGYTKEKDELKKLISEGILFLRKPFSSEDLLNAVYKTLKED